MLETGLPMVFVEGEISNLATPRSGHWYFTLKDENAQLRCAMFRNRNHLLRFTPKDGMQVVVRGRVTLYEGRGEFQMVAEFIEEAGDGALRRAYDRLRARLQVEGLFDDKYKRPLPHVPAHVAIVTSPTGAAIRDVIAVFRRRFPLALLSILPVQVQGEFAERQIVRALAFANQPRPDPFDVILVTRGGGSLEDFAAFNSEAVARGIRGSTIPVVCAIGHESDTCIAEFSADLRAPTPSAAAEQITPDAAEWLGAFAGLETRLVQLMRASLERQQQALLSARRQLQHPRASLEMNMQRLDAIDLRLQSGISRTLREAARRTETTAARVRPPTAKISTLQERVTYLAERAQLIVASHARSARRNFEHTVQRMNALSPLATLERGYAIVSHDGGVLRTATAVKPGDTIEARLMTGAVTATVTNVSEETDD